MPSRVNALVSRVIALVLLALAAAQAPAASTDAAATGPHGLARRSRAVSRHHPHDGCARFDRIGARGARRQDRRRRHRRGDSAAVRSAHAPDRLERTYGNARTHRFARAHRRRRRRRALSRAARRRDLGGRGGAQGPLRHRAPEARRVAAGRRLGRGQARRASLPAWRPTSMRSRPTTRCGSSTPQVTTGWRIRPRCASRASRPAARIRKAGTIDRDAGGPPTGVLKEAAQDLVVDLIPPPTPEQRRAGILAEHRDCCIGRE